MLIGKTRLVLIIGGILLYAVFARLVHSDFVQPNQQGADSSMSTLYLICLALLSVLALVYACRSIRSSQFSQADWGLGIAGKAWISIPILAVVITLSRLDAESGVTVTFPHALISCLILLLSSIFIRAIMMRLISNALKQEIGVSWLSTAVTGLLFTIVHPNTNATFLGDLTANFLSSSFISITGSIFAPVVYDAIRLLNPPDSQAAVLIPCAVLVLYLVLTVVTGLCVKRDQNNTPGAGKP